MGLFVSKLIFSFNSTEKISGKLMPLPIGFGNVVSRKGRHLQRYDKQGCRQVVGCIPYRYRDAKKCLAEELEVLVISSQKGKVMCMFPKGGWEIDESMEEAASRETLEEAGVVGTVECRLGKWCYESRSHATTHKSYMFPMLVKKQFDLWPEKNIRERKWVSVGEAREMCQHWWMKEALDLLIDRQKNIMHLAQNEETHETTCTLKL